VFEPFAARTRVFSFCEPAHTDALEFRDGKIMLGKHASVKDVSWENLSARVGKARLRELLNESSLVSMNNWTMLPLMSDIWAHLQREICPKLDHSKERIAFFDLADPTKRKPADLKRAIQLIKGFQRWFKTVLGVNKRESALVAQVLGLPPHNDELESVKATAAAIQSRLKLDAVVVHTREYAMSASGGDVVVVASAFAEKPLISTGAGDHFNAGYCIGRLLGFDAPMALKTGTSVANYYVRTAESPNCGKLVPFLKSLAKSAR
jgi:sugar/nucleoside kinase (ribokinase family)